TDYYAGNLTDTTGKGNTAHNAGCNGVHLPALSISRGTGSDHSHTFQPGTESIEDTCQNESTYGYAQYGNTGNCRRLRVSADCVQILSECGFIPDEPYDHD